MKQLSEQYEPFGPEWRIEINKWNKNQLIDHLRQILMNNKDAESEKEELRKEMQGYKNESQYQNTELTALRLIADEMAEWMKGVHENDTWPSPQDLLTRYEETKKHKD
jgi:hypothetical protein